MFRSLKLMPGVDLESTPTLNETRLAASNLIRYYRGLLQKLGGWTAKTLQTFVGTCRGLHGWSDISGNTYMAIGTEQRLQVFAGGSIVDITPIVQTDNPAVAFSTTSGQTAVTVTDSGFAPQAGDWINLQTQVSVGGIILFGYYQVASVVSGTQYTITAATPATATVTNSGAVPSYATQNGSATVTVTLNNHGFVTGSIFNAAVSTTVATVVIFGTYSVTLVNANSFTITASPAANATTSGGENGGNANIQYLLPTGPLANGFLSGYGAGDYGSGDYGGTGAGSSVLPLRQWSLDNFGQDLIASPTNGKIYFWQPPNITPATVVSGSAPLFSTAVFVLPQAEIILALGAEISGTQQPLLSRWCDAGDFTDWIASATNQAGSFSLSSGSALIGGLATGLGATIWTDEAVWSVTYIGFPLVLSFQPIAHGCGLIGARAAGILETTVMWLSPALQFFTYTIGGGVSPIECSVFDFLQTNIDRTSGGLVHCAINADFNELAWHFPLLTTSPLFGASTQFAYVKFNLVENAWDFGVSSQYQRTASAPRSAIGGPIGADLAGLLQEHEVGYDANGASMMWSWQTGDFDMAEGEEMVFSDMMFPDFITIGMPHLVPTLLTRDAGNAPYTPVVITQQANNAPFLVYSARGRQMSIGYSAAAGDLGTFWRLGRFRFRAAGDGKF